MPVYLLEELVRTFGPTVRGLLIIAGALYCALQLLAIVAAVVALCTKKEGRRQAAVCLCLGLARPWWGRAVMARLLDRMLPARGADPPADEPGNGSDTPA